MSERQINVNLYRYSKIILVHTNTEYICIPKFYATTHSITYHTKDNTTVLLHARMYQMTSFSHHYYRRNEMKNHQYNIVFIKLSKVRNIEMIIYVQTAWFWLRGDFYRHIRPFELIDRTGHGSHLSMEKMKNLQLVAVWSR